MKTCPIDQTEFDPTKDTFLTVHERKTASVDVCSVECANRLLEED